MLQTPAVARGIPAVSCYALIWHQHSAFAIRYSSLTRDAPNAYVPPPAFGPFRVLHQIGVGALGPVFRTYEPTRDRLVAVKVFRLDIVPEQAQALADALSHASEAGLFHPSIVEPIASGVEGSVAYRAEEYVAAESLDVAMRHYAPAPVEKALPFVTQLAGAIDFARAVGIGHGGLHPRDIFITPDDARATGFGVVEALEQSGIRAPVRRPYSAPERIEGQPWGVAADVFALAAITFELLTGRQPAGLGRDAGTLPDVANRSSVETVLGRAMDRDPARRYPTALAFAAALEAAWRGEKVEDTAIVAAPAPDLEVSPAAPYATPEALAPVDVHAHPIDDALAPADAHPLDDAVAHADALDDALAHAQAHPHVPDIEPTLFDRHDDSDKDVDATQRHHVSAFEPTVPLAVTRQPEPQIADSMPLARDVPGDDEDDHEATLALHAHRHEPERFSEFVDAQDAEGEERRPLEAEGEREPAFNRDAEAFTESDRTPAFGAVDDEPRGRGFASYVAVAVFGLILGFGAAYFMWGRNNVPPAETAAAATPAPSTTTETPPSPRAEPQTPSPAAASPKGAGSGGATASAPTAAPAPSPAPPAAAEPSFSTRRENPSAAAAPVRGQITVKSTPSKAGVTVNGKWRGRTPLTLDSLPFGNYVVRVVQPDYKTAREQFALNAQSPSRALNVHLESDKAAVASARRSTPERAAQTPVTFTGTLFVDSHPQGATVVIDGKAMGKTPLRLPDMRIGTHVVRLELARHRPWYSTARVVSGQEVRVAGSLEEIQ